MSSTRSSFRLETRSRARDEIRRIVQTVDKVRKWEKKWVDLGLSNSVKVYKWVPVREDSKDDEEDDNKENEPMELPTQDESSIDIGILSSATLNQDLTPSESLPPNILEDEVEGNKEDTTSILTESEQPLQTTLLPDNILTAASDAVNNQTPEIASEHSAVSCEQILVNTDNYTEPGPFNIQDSSLDNNDMKSTET